ncbi:MAG TPA: type VI secretion system Vgr family protein [Ideonella sp.]|nr:type VI secretion system Vgr family protein [Ideonella sp.]
MALPRQPASVPSHAAASSGSALQTLLAALGPSQHQRLLRLSTPLGPDVLLAERVEAVEAIGPGLAGEPTGFCLELLALSTNAHLVLKALIGQPVRLDLLASGGRLRPWHGHVTAFTRLGSDAGLARYQLRIEPWLALLAHTHDAWVFCDQTVVEIIDEIFAGYRAQGRLVPAWRWELQDAGVYPRRSLCVQYQESDLAFVQRLLADEGLFYWFEHATDDGDSLGSHTLVISDHNGSFQPNAQPLQRFTQSGASFDEDSLTRWHGHHRTRSDQLALSSWDYRAVQQAAAEAGGAPMSGPALALRDQPGAYHFEDDTQAARIARRRLEALQAPAHQFQGLATVRSSAPGTRFTLAGHDSLDGDYLLLRVRHRARNNLSADARATLRRLLGDAAPTPTPALHGQPRPLANASDEPLYQAELLAQAARQPVRAPAEDTGGRLLHPKPNAPGVQSATVVGSGSPVHTDRDGRIKLQFHWQRGARSAHRLGHAGGDNAPGNDGAGTWVRVGQGWAGANWGSHHTPRVGQEVLVGFVEGDIDRPVVIGTAYGGAGQPDAQGNQVGAGPTGLSGNAPAWFPGNRRSGELEGHQHPQVLSGYKSQSLEASAVGQGGYNQLVLDDSPGQARTTLGSTSAATWLHLGHLLQQDDNQRLAHRGHGLALSTEAQGAVRAGGGLLISAWAQPGGTGAGGHQMQAREAISQLEQAGELQQTLADSAQQHNAKLGGEAAAAELPTRRSLQATVDSLASTDSRGTEPASAGEIAAIDGGHGTTPAWSRPDLLVTAPAGIAALTPAHGVLSAGATLSVVAGQDLHLGSQRNTAVAVKAGLSLFSYGQAQNPDKPNRETGMQLHAASGSVSVQAQQNTLKLTADKAIEVSSTGDAVHVSSPVHVLLTAGGSYLRIEGDNIEIGTSGPATFKGMLKELAGGARVALPPLNLPRAPLDIEKTAAYPVSL